MSRPLFTNNASTVLARAITPTDTILQLTAGTGQYFPQPTIGDYFMLTLVQVNNPEVSEIVECIERVGDVLTVVRGQEGTQPQIFNISDSVELRITAGSLNLFAIGGGGGGSASGTSVADFTATQGQTVFTLPFSYTQGIDNLAIFINGSKQVVNVNYTESTSTSFTMASGLNAGDVVQAIYNLPLAGGVINSSNVTYNEQSTGAVNRTVQSKLQEIVSVQDFGFSTSNTASQNKAAFVAAIASLTRPSYLYVPQGFYNIAPGIDLGTNCYGIQGAGKYETYLASTTGTSLFTATANPFQYFSLKDIGLQGSSTQYGFYAATMNHSLFENVLFTGFTTCALYLGGYSNDIVECDIFSNTGSGINLNGTLNNVNVNNNRIYANGGIGIYINPTDVNAGLQINITGNAIEANAVAGIIAFNTKALNIKNNYFERNSATGYTYSVPESLVVYADIHLLANNAPALTTNYLYANQGPTVQGNHTTPNGSNGVGTANLNGFIFTTYPQNLTVKNNQVFDTTKVQSLISIYQNNLYTSIAGELNISSNSLNTTGYIGTYNSATQALATTHLINDSSKSIVSNYATKDASTWTALSGTTGTISASGGKYGNVAVYQITDGDKEWGKTIDLTVTQELKGQWVWFGLWANDQGSATTLNLYINGVSNGGVIPLAGTSVWQYVSVLAYIDPAATSFTYGVKKIGTGSAFLINNPILTFVGNAYNEFPLP